MKNGMGGCLPPPHTKGIAGMDICPLSIFTKFPLKTFTLAKVAFFFFIYINTIFSHGSCLGPDNILEASEFIGGNLEHFHSLTLEPWHDKTNKMSVRAAKTQISLGIRPVWSVPFLWVAKVAKHPCFLHVDSEDSEQTGRMPRLICVFAQSFCWFCHVEAHLLGGICLPWS